ncbi:MAG: hypothetical protein P1V35_11100 [Planctomycetota bacterium]|nr:hypothetical protein [Planctomycetota bacterium]
MTESLPDVQEQETPGRDDTVLLRGWTLRLARIFLFTLLAWSIAVIGLATPGLYRLYTEVQPAFDSLHVRPYWSQGPAVSPWSGGLAEKSGLPHGTLLAIDGKAVAKTDSVYEVAERLRGELGTPVEFTVRDKDGKTVARTLMRSAPPWGDGISPRLVASIGQFLMMIVFLLGGLALLWRGGPSLVAIIGATSFLCLAGTGYTETLQLNAGGDWDGPLMRLTIVVGVLCLFSFLTLFPTGRVRPRWAWVIIVMAIAERIRREFDIDMPELVGNVLSGGIFPLILIAQIVRYRLHANEEQRLQTKWAVLGITFFLSTFTVIMFVFTSMPRERLLARELVLLVPALGMSVFVSGVVVSLLKYRLWDAEAAWSRSAMAAGLTLAVTAIIAGGTAIAQTAFGASGPMAMGLATVVAALLLVPLQHRLSDWAKRRFLRDLMDLKENLPQLVGHLRETESVESIAEGVTDRTCPVVHATHTALIMPDENGGWFAAGVEGIEREATETWAADADLDAVPTLRGTRRQPWRDRIWSQPKDRLFPVRVALRSERAGGEVATEGWLLLGPRPDGSGYGSDELEAVATVAGPIGRAIRVVRVRENRLKELTTMWEKRHSEQDLRLEEIKAQLRDRPTE